tara:strand:- start:3397 stop:3897 length:501 start_codon:yes stop_codon:yes gene_type:complete
MRFSLQSIALVVAILSVCLLAFCSSAYAQGSVELHFVPEGQLIEYDGVTMMAYDLEGFRLVADVDVRLQSALEQLELLEGTLALNEDSLDEAIMMVEALQEQLAISEGAMAESRQQTEDALQLVESCTRELERDSRRRNRAKWWHPVWGPIAIGSTTAVILVTTVR